MDARFSSGVPEQASAPRFYLPELDVLRFFAFLAVFLEHAFGSAPMRFFLQPHQFLRGRAVSILTWSGGYGVDLFFALSAFLITQLLMREQAVSGTLDVRRFYIRRILRIWPLYFAFLLFVLIFKVSTVGIGSEFYSTTKWAILLALLSGNIANALWGWTPDFILSHLWSISVEEQFYVLWPLTIRGKPPRSIAMVALAMIAISVGARTICWLTSAPAPLVWTNTLTRLDPFAGGILLGIWTMGKQFRPPAVARVTLLMLGVATLWLVSATCNPYWTPNSALTLFFGYPAVTFGCIAIITAFLGVRVSATSLVTRAGIYLGKISYGLYIWHLAALELMVKLMARVPFASGWRESRSMVALCALGLTVAVAAASYRLLETPFLRLKSRFAVIPSRPA